MPVEELTRILRQLELSPDERDVLDVIWLAGHLDAPSATGSQSDPPDASDQRRGEAPDSPDDALDRDDEPASNQPATVASADAAASEYSLHARSMGVSAAELGRRAARIRVPAAPALGSRLDLTRAWRPFKRRVPSRHEQVLDEEATAARIADSDLNLWLPAMRPARERWLELALVVDGHESMAIWRRSVTELRQILERLGAFKDVRSWILDHPEGDPAALAIRKNGTDPLLRSWRELIDPTGRRVIVVISDCLGPSWRTQHAQAMVGEWARRCPVAIVQPLPQRLWLHSYARPSFVELRAPAPACPNVALRCRSADQVETGDNRRRVPVPVLELDPLWLSAWGRLVAAPGAAAMNAMAIFADEKAPETESEISSGRLLPDERVRRFRASVAPEAMRLAECLSAAPISLPVIRLVQEAMLEAPRQSYLAEVLLGGLFYRLDDQQDVDAEDAQYEFLPGVRDILLRRLQRLDALRVLHTVSAYVGTRFGQARDFQALLVGDGVDGSLVIGPQSRPFALVAEHVLRMLGGQFGSAADRLAQVLELAPVPTSQVEPEPADLIIEPAQRVGSRVDPQRTWLPGRRGRRKSLVCPYCYATFSESEIRFRCSGRPGPDGVGCVRKVDENLSKITGSRVPLPPVFAASERSDTAICPICASLTRTQVCPDCHSHLPATFRATQGRLIALAGPSQSGKTLLMTVLIHELKHRAGELLNSTTTGADDSSSERYDREHERRLYTNRLLFPRTVTTGQSRVPPLVFRFTLRRSRLRSQAQELLLSFADSAGEDLASLEKTGQMSRYFNFSDGLIVLIDPLQLPQVRAMIQGQVQLPRPLPRDEYPAAGISRITTLLRQGSAPGAKIDKPVAFVLTKIDVLRNFLPAGSPLLRPQPADAFFDASDSQEVSDHVRRLLGLWDAGDITGIIEGNYSNYAFFAVSALGAPPTAENRVAAPGVEQYRVIDPFLWLLASFGLIRR